jgi:ribonuclease P/MRP protein subunit RPP40
VGNSKKLYCAFVDFKKAFDSVYRNGLWVKLYNMGLRGKVWSVLRNMYSVVKSCVKNNCVLSVFLYCAVGLRQGEILSPVLFSLFIEDLENSLQRNIHDGIEIDQITLFLLLFADDVVLFSETPEGLQRSLDAVYDYCSRWSFAVNCDQTKIMVLKKGKQPQGLVFTYTNKTIEIVSQFTYLGSTFTPGGAFRMDYQTLSEKDRKLCMLLCQ